MLKEKKNNKKEGKKGKKIKEKKLIKAKPLKQILQNKPQKSAIKKITDGFYVFFFSISVCPALIFFRTPWGRVQIKKIPINIPLLARDANIKIQTKKIQINIPLLARNVTIKIQIKSNIKLKLWLQER